MTTQQIKFFRSCELTYNSVIVRHQSESTCCSSKLNHLTEQQNQVRISCVERLNLNSETFDRN